MRAGFGTPVLIWVVQSATCPPTVGVALGCAARGWFLRDDDPHGDVEHDARAAEDPQHEEQHSDQGRIHVEALGQATAHPGHLSISPAAVQLLARVHGTAFLASCSRPAVPGAYSATGPQGTAAAGSTASSAAAAARTHSTRRSAERLRWTVTWTPSPSRRAVRRQAAASGSGQANSPLATPSRITEARVCFQRRSSWCDTSASSGLRSACPQASIHSSHASEEPAGEYRRRIRSSRRAAVPSPAAVADSRSRSSPAAYRNASPSRVSLLVK